MTHYFCIAESMADGENNYSPTTRDFYAVESRSEFEHIIQAACDFFDAACEETPHKYKFRMPADGENNYSQRLRVTKDIYFVLDVIGMTESDYQREMGEMEDRSRDGGEF